MYKTGLVISATGILLLFACNSSKKATTNRPVFDSLQVKYAKYMAVEPHAITNLRLYRFVDEWVGTKYVWGGTTKSGIDCSALIRQLLADVYSVKIPRTSVQQFYTKNVKTFPSLKYLAEGDLVFFREAGQDTVSHVGLYLQNNWFINAEKTKGVKISKLDSPYWKQRLFAAGKVKLI
jgi:murein DD-endopeptidase / murein LD-carboxypeptidase